jgi:hypothetical protein
MNFKQYVADKALPNALIWGLGYLVIEKLARRYAPQTIEKIDWSALLDWNSLACLVVGVGAVIALGWLVAQAAGAPLFQACREECGSAITTFSSIGLVTGLANFNVPYILSAIAAYVIASRLS